MGPGFTLKGQEVSWQKWKFHFRLDPRRAVVVSNVRYDDAGRERSVLYQGSLSEVFVPYMDPSEGWYFLTYIDMGDYAGMELISSLEPGLDCPSNAAMFDMVAVDEQGRPRPRPRGACLFERSSGEVAWRHDSQERGVVESRPRRDLVLRAVLVIGNYDYVLDWVFRQDGVIEVEAGATGVVSVKAVAARTFTSDEQGRRLAEGRDDPYGRFVAEHTVAVNHDHYFAFRLDLDVDGAANSFVIDRLTTQRLAEPSPRRSVWTLESTTAKVEKEAQLHMSMEHPALWRFVNPKVRGRLGYPVSYEIRPGHNAMSLLLPEDFPQRRAGFVEHNLWVTPYRPDELFAAGDYTVQSRGGDGLPAWTAANRSIENADIVAWYTVGFHHVVRAEDWPVTPNMKHGFELRPFDFFSGNPAMDLPEKP
jgi:primary-amine oxidase